jgi:Luciferase-like monooxygenase
VTTPRRPRAAVTQRLELVTGILALPQRQTVLVAKQAAEVDVLSGGRLRLGVGLGWVEPEFQALGEPFTNRGQRIQEQIAVLRALFTQEVVTFSGRWHQLADIGIDAILTLTHGGPVPEAAAPLRPPAAWVEDVRAWQALGATHLSVNTMGAGLSVSDHLDAIGRFKQVVEAAVQL